MNLLDFDARKLARRTDPATSHAAADQIEGAREKHAQLILDTLAGSLFPLAAEQIADRAGDAMDTVQVCKRLNELVWAGKIVVAGNPHINRSGRRARKFRLAG